MARVLARALPWAAVAALLFAVAEGCSVDQVSLEGCRKIEDARCQVAGPCPNLNVPDVDACKRFYRDQCLHGLAVTTDPGDPTIDKCVAAINKAGSCAATHAATCDLSVTVAGTTACGIIQQPELATDCAWLIPPAAAVVTTDDAGDDADAADDTTTD